MLLKTDRQSLSSHSIMNGRNWNTMQMMTMMMKKKMIKGNIQKHMMKEKITWIAAAAQMALYQVLHLTRTCVCHLGSQFLPEDSSHSIVTTYAAINLVLGFTPNTLTSVTWVLSIFQKIAPTAFQQQMLLKSHPCNHTMLLSSTGRRDHHVTLQFVDTNA